MTDNIIDSPILAENERKEIVRLFVDLIRHNANKTKMTGFVFCTWDRTGEPIAYSKSMLNTDIPQILQTIEAELEADAADNSYMPDRFKTSDEFVFVPDEE